MPELEPPHPPTPLGLLKGVSRSFYLSVRVLPAPLRHPVAIGYLLARTSDTIADTPGLPASERLQALQSFEDALYADARQADGVRRLAAAMGALQPGSDERALLIALPTVLGWLGELAPADQGDVRDVLRHITRGQRLDVERFGAATARQPRALANAGELEEYTFLVAGCVGEFWTRLGLRHLPRYATLPDDEMLSLGRSYGMGLQLVNILRDAGEDLAAGRCYFPADALAAAGLTPAALASDPERFVALAAPWRARAEGCLADGMRYALAVNARRVRAGTALPALLGVRTLALLQQAGGQTLQHKVKMPRHEVRRVLAATALSLAGRGTLDRLFHGLRK